jgi:hypothetical protein
MEEESKMADWSIESKDGTTPYTTEDGFIAALRDLFGDPKEQRFISATLSDGTVLDKAAAEKLAGFTIGENSIGEGPGLG